MSDQDTKTKQDVTPEPETKQQPTEVSTEDSDIDFEALSKEIDDASNKIVSEDVRKLIANEREEARKQALKEAESQHYLKEKEAEIERLKKQQEEKERQSAEQLAQLKKKVDDLTASRAVVQDNNPFKKGEDKPTRQPFDLREEELDDVEKASFYEMLSRKQKS